MLSFFELYVAGCLFDCWVTCLLLCVGVDFLGFSFVDDLGFGFDAALFSILCVSLVFCGAADFI